MKSRKTFLISLLASVSTLTCALALTSCDVLPGGTLTPPNNHEHAWGEWTETVPATCTEDGELFRVCTVEGCGFTTETQTIPALGHDVVQHEAKVPTCREDGWYEYETCNREECPYSTYQINPINYNNHDLEYHEAKEPTCTRVGWYAYKSCKREECYYVEDYVEIRETGNHIYEEGVCTTCDAPQSEGLQYYLPPDEDSYYVIGLGNCEDTDVFIPSTYQSKPVTRINIRAFYNCGYLTSIVIPNSVTSIGEQAFSHCSNLTSISIPESVTSIEDHALFNCTSLTNIKVSANNSAYKDIDGNLYRKDGKNLTLIQYALGKTETPFTIPDSVTSIGNSAFQHCSNLTSIVMPNSLTSIGYHAFYDCSNLTSVTIPNSVTSIDIRAFYGCSNLTSAVIGDSVTSIAQETFRNCSSLKSVVIGDSVTSIGDSAFQDCYSLTSIEMGDSVTTIGIGAFSKCRLLTSIKLPKSVTTIGIGAFYGCNGLKKLVIPKSVTSIGERAFFSCNNLTIYCETESQPSGWDDNWNSSNCPVEWGYSEVVQGY